LSKLIQARLCKAEYYQRNKEKLHQQRAAYYRVNPIAQGVKNARQRAKKKGWDFDLVADKLIVPEFCPVLGLRLEVGVGRMQPNSPSIDRIDSRKGYTMDNVRIISMRANNLKRDMTVEEARLIYEDVLRLNV
jgi:hypothetical protein